MRYISYFAVAVLLTTASQTFADIQPPLPELIDGHWWEVQEASPPYTTLCEGAAKDGVVDECAVGPGTYNAINHTTGERFENIVYTDDSAEPTAIDVRDFVQTVSNILESNATLVDEAVCPGGPGEWVAVMGTCTATLDGKAIPILEQGPNDGFGISGWGCRTDTAAFITAIALCVQTGNTYEPE